MERVSRAKNRMRQSRSSGTVGGEGVTSSPTRRVRDPPIHVRCSDSHSAACSREPSPNRVTCVDSRGPRDRAMADEVRTQAFIDARAARLDKGASGSLRSASC
jgi:hypothetical protein